MLSKAYRTPREIDERDLVFDARPKTAQEAAEEVIQDMKEMPEPTYPYNPGQQNALESERFYHRDGWPDNVVFEHRNIAKRSPIDAIAEMMRDLTYGEMVELAGEIWAVSDGEINAENLPQILWDWAVSP